MPLQLLGSLDNEVDGSVGVISENLKFANHFVFIIIVFDLFFCRICNFFAVIVFQLFMCSEGKLNRITGLNGMIDFEYIII